MSETEIKDELPKDLDVTKYVGPYQFPSPKKRRTASISISAVAVSGILLGYFAQNLSMIVGGAAMLIVAIIFFLAGWPLNVNDLQALTSAATQAPFSVGHASAQLCFTGWSSKPRWRVVVFSADEPPSQRGMVEIDAVTKNIVSTYFDELGTEGLDQPLKTKLKKSGGDNA